jgi:2-polyprenyl-6-methoxyphenol hydroxylase-like FAD-dependent oxidoreductase
VRADGVYLSTDAGEVEAELLVAADGINSPLRHALGLHVEFIGARRFGLRRHLHVAPWGPRVEVHFAPSGEAYVTPVGPSRVGVAFLWRDGALSSGADFASLLAHFPVLQERVAGAAFESEARGAGPLRQSVRRRTLDRVVLLGDAAGYVDAITGEGLSLAFEGAQALGACLPDALARRGAVAAFAPYEAAVAHAFARYSRLAGSLVWAASHPALRRWVLNRLIAQPPLFSWALRHAIGAVGEPVLTPRAGSVSAA